MEAHLIFKGCKTVEDCEEKLNELIESWPVVYKYSDSPNWMPNDKPMSEKDGRFFSFDQKARLAFIEEIVKEPCKHEPRRWANICEGETFEPICFHCGVELKATWSEK